MTATRKIGVAHLTLLDLTPPQLVETAAAAGFDFIGVRVKAVTSNEPAYPMSVGSPMLAETLMRLDDTGLTVADIEFLPLTPTTTREDWVGALESGQALGASAMTVTGADADRSRLLDTLAQLAAEAANYGIRPLLEPISYQPVSRVEDAAQVARATGAGLMLDALHLQRGGSPLSEISALEPELIPIVQLCDALLNPPAPLGSPQAVELLQHEARVQRLLIGEGELRLLELLRRLPARLPISVELPHAELQAHLSPLEYATRNLQAARELVALVGG